MEKNAIFGEGVTIKDRGDKDIRFGILSRQSFEDKTRKDWRMCTRHRVLLPLVGILMFASFLAAGIWISIHPQ